MHTKCPHCATVNWSDAEFCVRCRLSPDQPVENQAAYQVEVVSGSGSSSGKFVVGGFVLVIAFCGYMFLGSSSKPAANQAAVAAANASAVPMAKPMSADDLVKAFNAEQAKDPRNQRIPSSAQQKEWTKKATQLGKPQPDCRMTGSTHNPSTGQMSPVMQCN